jgi:site-specific DNA recombinase
MKAIGYVRVSTEKQSDFGVSLEAQTAKVQAMAVVQGADLMEVIIDAGESAKSLNRPGMARLLSLVDSGAVDTVIIAKLDRLTRSVKDLAELLERFTRRGVSLVSVADSLDTGSAAGRLVLNIMVSVSQWEREAIGERTRDAMGHKRAKGERVGTFSFGYHMAADGVHLEADAAEQGILSSHAETAGGGLHNAADFPRTEPPGLHYAARYRMALSVCGGSATGGVGGLTVLCRVATVGLGGDMAKRTGKAAKRTAPKKDRAWFEQKIAELKTELEKLPADRQDLIKRNLNAVQKEK